MAIISIIIPVYNTGIVIHDTINSILNQSYTDFELLLIDDGSTDGTGKICDEYAAKDSRIKVYHKENGGICDARNYGLSKVNSKYLTFCDHDDLYDEKLLETAIKIAEREMCEVVKYSHKTYYEDNRRVRYYIHVEVDEILQNEILINKSLKLISSKALEPIWDAIYLTDFILKNNIKFDTSFKHGGEDIDFSIKWFKKASKISVITPILYTHIVRKSLSTSSKFYDDIFYNFLYQVELINNLIKEINIDVTQFEKNYMKIVTNCVIGCVSYGVQMKKTYRTIKQELDKMNVILLITKKNAYNTEMNLKMNLSCFLFKKRMYYLLFFLCKIKKICTNE